MDSRSTATQEKIAQAQEAVGQVKDELLKSFSFVPEDRLGWSPSPTARTAVWLVAHCGVANGAFASLLRGKPMPLPKDPEERAARIRAGGQDVTDRAEAVRSIEDSTAAILLALDGVTDAMIASSPDSPFGTIPFAFWMTVPADHMKYHVCQLNYLQTIWGDLQEH